MARKKKEVTPEVVATPVEKQPSIADKQYIYKNYDKLGVEVIAQHTGLSVLTINRLINSPELDEMPSEQKKPAKNLRRFYENEGSVIMTPQQSHLGDEVHKGTELTKEEKWKKRYGADVQPMKWKNDINILEK